MDNYLHSGGESFNIPETIFQLHINLRLKFGNALLTIARIIAYWQDIHHLEDSYLHGGGGGAIIAQIVSGYRMNL